MQVNDMQNCNQDVRKPIINVGLFTSELSCLTIFIKITTRFTDFKDSQQTWLKTPH